MCVQLREPTGAEHYIPVALRRFEMTGRRFIADLPFAIELVRARLQPVGSATRIVVAVRSALTDGTYVGALCRDCKGTGVALIGSYAVDANGCAVVEVV